MLDKKTWTVNNDHLRMTQLLVRKDEAAKRLQEIIEAGGDAPFDAAQIGIGGGEVLLAGEEERDVDRLLRQQSVLGFPRTMTLRGLRVKVGCGMMSINRQSDLVAACKGRRGLHQCHPMLFDPKLNPIIRYSSILRLLTWTQLFSNQAGIDIGATAAAVAISTGRLHYR